MGSELLVCVHVRAGVRACACVCVRACACVCVCVRACVMLYPFSCTYCYVALYMVVCWYAKPASPWLMVYFAV